MLSANTAGGLAPGSAPAPEKSARTASFASATASASAPKKLRSCAVCRSRKVRCDKQSPCSNCRRANIACVVPSNDRPPRWARRIERITNNAATATPNAPHESDPGAEQVVERLRNLENLVKELSAQLEQANSASSSAAGGSPRPATHVQDQMDTASNTNSASMQKQFGRLVLQDSNRSRYVSSGFWSRVSDELAALKMDAQGLPSGDSDSSDDGTSPGKTPSTQELERSPSARHAFLFGHNLDASTPDLRDFRPLPSQIPFLLDTFSENVNLFLQIVHLPTVTRTIREQRGASNTAGLSPSNEALLFSIYYAAVTSMEDDDVLTNFGATKAELNLKFRLGFEHALAKADFLNAPNLTLVQAFAIFLFLVRRHDSPRFVWMMTGLIIRMAQAIGLHRDGSQFGNLSPYEVEMRRRVWWGLCMLDVRASEDQGMDFSIASGSFDTKLPLNINDADFDPETKETPAQHEALTDMSLTLVTFEMCEVTRRMMTPGVGLEEQSRLLSHLYDRLEQGYLRYLSKPGNVRYWVGVTATRLVISKLTLLIYLPTLLSSPGKHFSDEIQNKLLVAAIEVAEYNHSLNEEQACRQWRWIYQTYTHWYAVVYMLLEICRRQWSPIVERAWIALHSSWLIPTSMDKNLRIWVPLRKLMAKARKHRETELERLRGDTSAVAQLELGDSNIPLPTSEGPFPSGRSEDMFREHWRSLVTLPAHSTEQRAQKSGMGSPNSFPVLQSDYPSGPRLEHPGAWSDIGLEAPSQVVQPQLSTQSPSYPTTTQHPSSTMVAEIEQVEPFRIPADQPGGQPIGSGPSPWLWADVDLSTDVFTDVDINMEADGDMNWTNWLQSATGMDLNARPGTGSWPTPMSRQ